MTGLPRIGDYAPIGDCRGAALVSRVGAIDWLCWPRFDAPSLFGALIDDDGGSWRLAPATPFSARRRYLDDTNVLETTFVTDGGRLEVIDFMPVASEADKRRVLTPDHEILRIARCQAGEVELEQRFSPRPGYGKHRQLRDAGALGLRVESRQGTATLRTTMQLARGDADACGRVRLRAGDVVYASLTFADDWPAVLPPLGRRCERALERTIAWWRAWTARLRYDGPFADAVKRSALALKLLCYAPSGAVVAAPTTSLPERIGGKLNWDYRYCWLRDASLTMRALMAIGYEDEAEAFASWLMHSTRLTRPRLRILYDVYGNLPAPRRSSAACPATPARARSAWATPPSSSCSSTSTARSSTRWRRWRAPDASSIARRSACCAASAASCAITGAIPTRASGSRAAAARATPTRRLLCWVAVDRLLELGRRGDVRRLDLGELERTRAEIRGAIETQSWSDEVRQLRRRPRRPRRRRHAALATLVRLHQRGRAAHARDLAPRVRRARRPTASSIATRTAARPARAHSASAASGRPSTWRSAAAASRRPSARWRRCWRAATTSACSPRRSIPKAATRSATFRRRSRTSA